MAARASLFLASALSLGAMSSSKDGIPALARCAAMREPMVPAPSTAARRTRKGCVEVSGDETRVGAVTLMENSSGAAHSQFLPREVSRGYGTARSGVKEALTSLAAAGRARGGAWG